MVLVSLMNADAAAQAMAPAEWRIWITHTSFISKSFVIMTPAIAENLYLKNNVRDTAKGVSMAP